MLITILSATFYTCKNPFDGLEILANGDVYGNAPTGIVFVDANLTNPTPIGNFDVTISGENADKVINEVGKKEFKVVGGLLSLALQEGVKPSDTNPINFTISAEVSGYIPLSQNITLTHDSVSIHMIKLVQLKNLPEGTSGVVGNNTTLSGNATAQTKTFTIPTNETKQESATVQMQSGTQFISESGAVLTGGTLTTNIVQYSAVNNSALQAIPGGLLASNVVDKNGNKLEGVTISPIGVVTIDMKVGDQNVKKFSKPLKVDMEINSQLINPNTSVAYKAGDEVSVWSGDKKNGTHTEESKIKLASINGKLIGSFEVPHLSTYYIGHSYLFCFSALGPRVNLINTGNASIFNNTYIQAKIDIINKNNQILKSFNSTYYLYGINEIYSYGIREEVKLKFSTLGGLEVLTTEYFNPCNNRSTINLDASKFNDINFDINVEGRCVAKKTTVMPNGLISISKRDESYPSIIGYRYLTPNTTYIKNGKGSLSLTENATYKIEVSYDGRVKSSIFTFNKSNMTLPTDNGLTGTITYDDATRKAILNAKFNLPNCN